MTGSRARRALLGASLLLAGCGYQPARDVLRSGGPLAVVAGESHVADPLALPEVVQGARAALAREGALGEGGGRLRLTVLALDEGSSGIVDRGAPLARGVTLTLVARATLEQGGASIDVGEVTLSSSAGAETSGSADVWRRDDAVRDLARRVGRGLGARAIAKSAENPSAGAVAPTVPR